MREATSGGAAVGFEMLEGAGERICGFGLSSGIFLRQMRRVEMAIREKVERFFL